MFTVDLDEAAGLIRSTSGGFLTVPEVLEHVKRVIEVKAHARQKFGYVRMLVVSRDSVVQSPEVMKTIQEGRWHQTDPRDRLAVVVSSTLAKRQRTRSFKEGQERVFLSESEAVAWLMSEGNDSEIKAPGDPEQTLTN